MACKRELGAQGTVGYLCEGILAQLLLVQDLQLFGNLHGKRLQEEVLADVPLHLVLALDHLLLLLGGVLQRAWRSAIPARLYLLVESHRHVCLLQFCRQLPESRGSQGLGLIIVNRIALNLLVYLHKDALVVADDQVGVDVRASAGAGGRVLLALLRHLALDVLHHLALLKLLAIHVIILRLLVLRIWVLILRDLLELHALLQPLFLDHGIELHLRLLVALLFVVEFLEDVRLLFSGSSTLVLACSELAEDAFF